MNERPKIALLTSQDPNDRRSWSGIYYYISRALQTHCGEVTHLGPIRTHLTTTGRLVSAGLRRLTGKRYLYLHTALLSKRFARLFGPRIEEGQFDVIVAPSASTELAYLETRLPIVYITDATIALMIDYYSSYFGRPFRRSRREANRIEQLAIDKADLIICSSSWAQRSLCNDYHADVNKVHVVPFGANFDEWPFPRTLHGRHHEKTCHLLFVGNDWRRKGGQIAVDTLVELEKLGVSAKLTIVGCVPPVKPRQGNIEIIPLLDKNDHAQYKRLAALFHGADFCLLPTRAECTAIVISESVAFGLPVIATNTGGVSEVVREGENGYLLSTDAPGIAYATVISNLYNDNERYWKLRFSSRQQFETRLNWDVWGTTVSKLIMALIQELAEKRLHRMM